MKGTIIELTVYNHHEHHPQPFRQRQLLVEQAVGFLVLVIMGDNFHTRTEEIAITDYQLRYNATVIREIDIVPVCLIWRAIKIIELARKKRELEEKAHDKLCTILTGFGD